MFNVLFFIYFYFLLSYPVPLPSPHILESYAILSPPLPRFHPGPRAREQRGQRIPPHPVLLPTVLPGLREQGIHDRRREHRLTPPAPPHARSIPIHAIPVHLPRPESLVSGLLTLSLPVILRYIVICILHRRIIHWLLFIFDLFFLDIYCYTSSKCSIIYPISRYPAHAIVITVIVGSDNI